MNASNNNLATELSLIASQCGKKHKAIFRVAAIIANGNEPSDYQMGTFKKAYKLESFQKILKVAKEEGKMLTAEQVKFLESIAK